MAIQYKKIDEAFTQAERELIMNAVAFACQEYRDIDDPLLKPFFDDKADRLDALGPKLAEFLRHG